MKNLKINELLKAYRRRLQLSQEEVADQLGVSRQTISGWESGTTHLELFKYLEQIFFEN